MPATPPRKGLIWIGDGTRFIPGVPARDLAPEEVDSHGRPVLIASGLYTEAASASAVNDKADRDKE
jgi:hypothetical protein